MAQNYVRRLAAYGDALSTNPDNSLSKVVLSFQRRLLCTTRVCVENGDSVTDSLLLLDRRVDYALRT